MSLYSYLTVYGLAMSAIALVGGLSAVLSRRVLERLTLPLVAFAAGALMGGAAFHMMPHAVARIGPDDGVFVAMMAGLLSFFVLEQFLDWHHCHRAVHDHRRAFGVLILLADGLHNLLGGLAIGAVFVHDPALGAAAWIAAAAHELPQEMGDFGVLLHSGMSVRRALLLNLVSGLTFPLGMFLAPALNPWLDVGFLIAFGAGNFFYIAASDLVPEVKHARSLRGRIVHVAALFAGVILLFALKGLFSGHH